MLKKSLKLNTSEFKEVFNFGSIAKSPCFIVKTKENTLTHPRFAVVVSKKISKKAVERNYIRRRFFHAIEDNIVTFDSKDYIFILNSSVKELQYKDITNLFAPHN